MGTELGTNQTESRDSQKIQREVGREIIVKNQQQIPRT